MKYTVDEILEIIKMYHINIVNVREYRKEYKSVGVSVISDEIMATGGTSDPVQTEALKHINNSLFYSQLATDIKYLEQRLDRITSERNAQVVALRMQGFTRMDIAEVLGVSKMTVGRLLKIAANEIKG